jgi:hypothetical protein
MRVLNVLRRRLLVSLGVMSATAVILLGLTGAAIAQQPAPPSAWPVLQLANPSPGAVISNGDYVISGAAFDPSATQMPGVSRVDLFLGDRSQGGIFLGSAVPGQDAMSGLTAGTPASLESFQLTVTLPSAITGRHDLVAYAYSAETGNVTTESMPIYVGVAPTPMATPAPQPVAEIGHQLAVPQAQTLSLANPNAGDVVGYGDYVVSGAVDPSIERVQVFLGDRDFGGMMLGSAVPANGTFMLTVKIPTTVAGGHDFVVYAMAGNGQETRVAVPVYIGAPPTPTPRPT